MFNNLDCPTFLNKNVTFNYQEFGYFSDKISKYYLIIFEHMKMESNLLKQCENRSIKMK